MGEEELSCHTPATGQDALWGKMASEVFSVSVDQRGSLIDPGSPCLSRCPTDIRGPQMDLRVAYTSRRRGVSPLISTDICVGVALRVSTGGRDRDASILRRVSALQEVSTGGVTPRTGLKMK